MSLSHVCKKKCALLLLASVLEIARHCVALIIRISLQAVQLSRRIVLFLNVDKALCDS